jgi:hypothetical protein
LDQSASGSKAKDMKTGGANYVFARLRDKNASNSGDARFFKPKALTRMDGIYYDHDAFGKVTGDYVTSSRVTNITQVGKRSIGNDELILKDTLSMIDDIDHIVVKTKAEIDKVVNAYKKAGYETLPDGRKIKDIVTAL